MAAFVLALTVDLHLPTSQSLKDKRSVVRSIADGARRRYSVASAETGYADLHQRAELCFACVSGTASHAEGIIDEVERFVWSFTEVEVAGSDRSWMEVER